MDAHFLKNVYVVLSVKIYAMLGQARKNFRRKITNISAILPLMFLVYGTPAFAGNYYVSIKGSDQGKGTQSSPWRSVNKALSTVPADQQNTIRVGAGTFDLGGKVSVPSGVNLVGSGVGTTTILGELNLIKAKNLSIRGIKFSGKNYQYKMGILVRKSDGLELHNLEFNAYADQAINIERVSDSKIENIIITDSSYNKRVQGGGGRQTSAISMGNLTNFEFNNIKIDTRKRGGQGIGSTNDAWSPDKPWESPPGILTNVKFSNLDIKVDQWNAWGSGWTPQMALELWHHTCNNCEIANSSFNSTVSLATDNSTRIHVHHNLWYGPNNPFYACEVNSDNTEFNNNYIRGGTYPLAMFGKEGKNNLNVHHNIFEKTGTPILVGNFRGKMNNFKFVNNTVYINSATRLFNFEQGETPNQQIRNNIFYSSVGNIGNLLGASVGVDNNVFFNIKPVGSRAKTFDPKFRLSGSLPSSYYRPNSGSQAINFGAIQEGSPSSRVRRSSTGTGQER
ncbi:DUF1565 domain-containing protein [Aetokthonos hydrillicola Thurmond2011]|jgi:hypothetical protein|uniref:DUF1565 domain-containing protein n=1 Tax=Aetokthonos hydrillicola Thurmond2011 TaxID=2712845 RepID=A0AAP5M4B7_9CYAN|nr:DUF1565 domain-containing protein [Aetokthonos hydrillicola]MBO3457592.1 DUF1565 domain-containing protein [Aetokthonos hydrillicola CCALA 1050]MBW4587870.1 DUF1565 domain-containing protein [Aetokthonos hydrillicola CCALA 1050]MDR9894726.1 DUF1565 domain-containing protein [Aetokthonos hydrillicola Thurmond2011]